MKKGQGRTDVIKEMRGLSKDKLKLWIIQELSSEDCAYWLVEGGLAILQSESK